ncbi:unnamed protein product [Rhizoctonia solani]|uniref:N-alpha-acetyltransferase 40 n=1 Tax=Rhizoctonia solani TaxID=456999 RepID=A0A8H2XRX2_9AGAM|nr:unnamed protein product [Rhizoctonia solani]
MKSYLYIPMPECEMNFDTASRPLVDPKRSRVLHISHRHTVAKTSYLAPPPMPKSQIPQSRNKRSTKPERKLHKLEALADKANKLSLEELQEIFDEYLPAPGTNDGTEQETKRTWSLLNGPSLRATPELKDKVWALFEDNMRDIYIAANDSDIPWDPPQKRKELQHKKSRFIIVQKDTALEAFCSFRFEVEEDSEGDMRFLVYIYEIQVAEEHRGAGLCRRIFTALEGMCAELGVQVVMLTCFKCNTQALPVYAHLGFQEVEGGSETSQEFWKPIVHQCPA